MPARRVRITGLQETVQKLNKLGKLDPSEIENILLDGAKTIYSEAYINAPYETGALRRALVARIMQRIGGSFYAAMTAIDFLKLSKAGDKPGNRYPYIVEFGSKPHEISAAPGKKLKFTAGGNTYYATSVMNPGFKGRKFFEDAVKSKIGSVRRTIEAKLGALVERAAGTP